MRRSLRALGAALLLAAVACAQAHTQRTAPTPSGAPAGGLDHDAPRVRPLERPGWVEVEAQAVASDDEPPSRARGRALAEARRAAVEYVAGVRVKSGILSFERLQDASSSSLVQALLATRADALILDEELVSSQRFQLSGGYRVRVVLRARVLDRSAAADPDFRTEIQLGRTRFLDGEELTLALRSSRRARLYVLSLTESGAALLLPNAYLPDTRVAPGEWLHFPSQALIDRGVHLVARVPEGRRATSEALVVVALRGDRELDRLVPTRGTAFRTAEAEGAGGLLAELLAPLLELPADAWTFDQTVYEILTR
ncbi:MAG TPA: hypothetical protein VIY27_00635 [Myxococcota bacterium]